MAELTPYLCVADARAAMAWYADVLGAVPTHPAVEMPDGRIGYVELDIRGARVKMAEEYPELHVEAPLVGRGAAVTLHLDIDGVDAIAERMVAAGALLDRGPEDTPGVGRVAVLRDPFGHRWFLNQSLE